jgi:hypothetical protein
LAWIGAHGAPYKIDRFHHTISGLVQYHDCKVTGTGINRVASVGQTSTHLPQAVQASLNTA